MEALLNGWTIAALIGEGSLQAALTAPAEWPLPAWLRRTSTAYILFNAGHILSIGLLVGAILLLDLRLLGCFGRFPLAVLGPLLANAAAAGLLLAILTGLALYSVRPSAYLENEAFTAKLALLALGIANALLLRAGAAWRRALAQGEAGAAVRLSAAASLVLWPATLLAGRWIGFL